MHPVTFSASLQLRTSVFSEECSTEHTQYIIIRLNIELDSLKIQHVEK